MDKIAIQNPARRTFLRAVPAAAVAGLTLADASLFAASAAAQGTATSASSTFQEFSAQDIQNDMKALMANPGNKNLVDGKTFTMVLTTETAKNADEFEWHAGRDHIIQIVDGSTIIEVGGTPKNGHSIGPGEWKAPASDGSVSFSLNKGDMLVIPRMTPHKRNTAGTVTLILISPMGAASA
jgi:mannose-6-phosphate isomerase-like protein (cupin superfamily)